MTVAEDVVVLRDVDSWPRRATRHREAAHAVGGGLLLDLLLAGVLVPAAWQRWRGVGHAPGRAPSSGAARRAGCRGRAPAGTRDVFDRRA